MGAAYSLRKAAPIMFFQIDVQFTVALGPDAGA
jgi:hypothetical protein